jgi:Na+-driven multidrug efflux pump
VKLTMIIQFITVGLNILFAAILTIGWLTGKPYGAFGAGPRLRSRPSSA